MKNIFLYIIVAMVLSGCRLDPKPVGDEGRDQNVNFDLVCAKEINILPISINGAKAPKASFDFSIDKLKKYTTNNIVVHKDVELTLKESEINEFIHDFGTLNSLKRLNESERLALREKLESLPQNSTTIVMIYTPILYYERDTTSRPLRGIAFGKRDAQPLNILAYNKRNIDGAPVITKNQAWKIVLTHEFGHRLGVPANISHNKANHCTSRECIMYSRPDWQSVASVLLLNGMPYDFCHLCKAELKETKESCNRVLLPD
ncbi:hypothetical protein MNB_SV-6-1889 [hydrothermal vent metagenome]|uniref:Uncharacterized protein n=1 Tax=hydrothermal vent metagenome TaxID=652676 RepID=A0A1W1C4V5_9ZZZZ